MSFSHSEQMLLEAIKAAVRGVGVLWSEPISEDDWTQFLRLARAQKLLPLAYQAVFSCKAAESSSALTACRQQVVGQVAGQTVRTSEFMALYALMREAGFHPLVVKGLVCRSLYPNADLRTSADEDLLVPDREFSVVCDWLAENGMVPDRHEDPSAFEISWHGADNSLHIELHRRLFEPTSPALRSMNAFFVQANDRASEYAGNDGAVVSSLCPHDHLLYLLLHAYKHFIHSGFGLRQACDIGLWAERYSEEIDWDTLYEQCRSAHADVFASAVFALLRRWLGLTLAVPGKWAENAPDPVPMLHDMLSGGIYGTSDLSRLHSASVTLNAVESDRRGVHHSILASAFPPRAKLLRQYPELKTHPTRLPLVWAKRFLRYFREKGVSDNNSTAETLRLAKERTALLKYYGIL